MYNFLYKRVYIFVCKREKPNLEHYHIERAYRLESPPSVYTDCELLDDTELSVKIFTPTK